MLITQYSHVSNMHYLLKCWLF